MAKRDVVASIEAEFRRYKAAAEAAMAQLETEQLTERASTTDNSIATMVWHIAGNLHSRFSDFLASDGEKPWRDRESEFEARAPTREQLLEKWEDGWNMLLSTVAALTDDDLFRMVSIRGVALPVHAALHRSLAHVSYHVGQIVYLSKMMRSDAWQYLSIPPGGSVDYNRDPAFEKPAQHAARLAAPGSK